MYFLAHLFSCFDSVNFLFLLFLSCVPCVFLTVQSPLGCHWYEMCCANICASLVFVWSFLHDAIVHGPQTQIICNRCVNVSGYGEHDMYMCFDTGSLPLVPGEVTHDACVCLMCNFSSV